MRSDSNILVLTGISKPELTFDRCTLVSFSCAPPALADAVVSWPFGAVLPQLPFAAPPAGFAVSAAGVAFKAIDWRRPLELDQQVLF